VKTCLANYPVPVYFAQLCTQKVRTRRFHFKKIYLDGKKQPDFEDDDSHSVLLFVFYLYLRIPSFTLTTPFTSPFLSSLNWLLSKNIENLSNNLHPFIFSLFLLFFL